jgi:hypothetical protein
LEDLEKCAEKWLIGKQVQLVILVNINIDILEAQAPLDLFSSTCELEGSSESNLPYNLNITDLSEGGLATVTSKILQWYASHEPPIQLVQPQSGMIYLYRHHTEDKSRINQDEKTVFFDHEKGFTDFEVHITPKDFGIPNTIFPNLFKLPVKDLKEEFGSLLKEQEKWVAEKRAQQLLKDHGHGKKNNPDYKPSPEVGSSPAFPPFQPTKPLTCF